ncbi:hypothetical protein [Streptomyces sp. NBRC 110028]|uniref:hypothetical protein n=1 Tax=Streptomyces sp. NBRC 110028 TaxID=1621260 RepID=UPI000AA5D091|nr:hypothetical protein [Streptomyces sp. NBRC 110028]
MSMPPPPQGNPYASAPPQGNPYASAPPQGNPYAAAPPQTPYGHPQPAPGYPQAHQMPGYGQPMAGVPQPPTCRICAAYPAVEVTIRGHVGMLLMMRFLKWQGPFCRTCGTAMRRQATTNTLWQGWWSPFSLFIFNPYTIINNLVVRGKLNKLPEPGPATHVARPDPGKSVLQRPASYVALVPILWFLFLIVRGG